MTEELRKYWPSGLTGLVIKAAFHADLDVARDAWRSWQEQCDFDNAFWGDVRIASLAYRRLGGARDAKSLEPRLTGLRRYIWSTGKMRMQAALPLLRRYADNEVTFVPIKGAVLLARNPQALTDRFIADVDVLVDHASWEKAVDLALRDGWHPEKEISRDVAMYRMWQTHHSLSLLKGAKGAIDLHYFSLRLNRQRGADSMIWKRTMPGTLGEVPVILPHPSDQLAITFGHCFLYANPKSHEWVSDALATIATPGFDWDLFTDEVIDRELATPATAALTYLADELQTPIPPHVRQRILAHVREPFLGELAAYGALTRAGTRRKRTPSIGRRASDRGGFSSARRRRSGIRACRRERRPKQNSPPCRWRRNSACRFLAMSDVSNALIFVWFSKSGACHGAGPCSFCCDAWTAFRLRSSGGASTVGGACRKSSRGRSTARLSAHEASMPYG